MALFRRPATILAQIAANNSNKVLLANAQSKRGIARWVAPTLKELKRRRDKIGPELPQTKSSFLEWNYKAEVFAFRNRIGENFNRDLLETALTHNSYIALQKADLEQDGVVAKPQSNSELIVEGDSILVKCVREVFGSKYPKDIVDALVDYLMTDEMLAHVARYMGLTDIVKTAEFPVENSTLSNTFKAIVAALHESSGPDRTDAFIKDFLICQLVDKDIYDIWTPERPLEYLIELMKSKGMGEFEPRLCNQSAVNTILANYQVGLYHDRKLLGIGWGESIETAKETAALNAIQRLQQGNDKPTSLIKYN